MRGRQAVGGGMAPWSPGHHWLAGWLGHWLAEALAPWSPSEHWLAGARGRVRPWYTCSPPPPYTPPEPHSWQHTCTLQHPEGNMIDSGAGFVIGHFWGELFTLVLV